MADTILVVQDSPESAGLLAGLLEARGFQAHLESRGDQALLWAATTPPDLVLLDIQLHGMDGFEILQRLKSREATRSIPVLLVGSPLRTEERALGLQLGAVDFLSKPIQELELLTKVRTHLGLARLRTRGAEGPRNPPLDPASVLELLNAEVAQRGRVEAELARSEERYRTLFEESPNGIAWFDAQARLQQANPSFLRSLGLGDARPLLGIDLFQAPELPDGAKDRLLRGLTVSEELSIDFDALKARRHLSSVQSGLRVMAVQVLPIGQGAEGLEGYLMHIQDVTERRRSEAILASRSRLVEHSVDLSLEGLLQATLDEAEALTGGCIGFYQFVSADQDTLRLQAWSTRTEQEFCTAEGKGSHYPVGMAGIWADAVREGKPLIHNDYPSHPGRKGLPEGHAQVLRELVVPVFRAGRIVAVLGVGNKATPYVPSDVLCVQQLADLAWDLAERRRAEEELRRSQWAFRLVADHTYDWEFWEGPEGGFRYSSPACRRITGYAPEELPDLAALEALIHPEDLEAWRAHRPGTPQEGSHGAVDFRIRHRDGSERWIAHLCQPVFVDGCFQGQRGSNRDITEQRQAEAERRSLAAKVEQLTRRAGGHGRLPSQDGMDA